MIKYECDRCHKEITHDEMCTIGLYSGATELNSQKVKERELCVSCFEGLLQYLEGNL